MKHQLVRYRVKSGSGGGESPAGRSDGRRLI